MQGQIWVASRQRGARLTEELERMLEGRVKVDLCRDLAQVQCGSRDLLLLDGAVGRCQGHPALVIVECDNVGDVRCARHLARPLVACGMRDSCTVTLSSNGEEWMSVSLQRRLCPGVEEQEVLFRRRQGLSDYEHMALCVCGLWWGVPSWEF
ncbi:MAG: hypothetical protein ACOX7F_05225 [Eubacteriales bacterium]|jgi:hypothetical protein